MMTRDQIQTVLDALEYIKLHVPFSDEDGTMYSESAIAILTAALAEPSEPIEPNNDEVICQKCAHQFRAIPVNVQKLLMGKGIDPPFTHPASKPDAPLLRTFLDEAKKEGITHISLKMGKPAPLPELTDEELSKLWDEHTIPVFDKTGINPIVFARAILAAAREKAK